MFENISIDDRFVRSLPADPEAKNFRRQVVHACYSKIAPTPVAEPKLIAYSREMAELLGFSVELLKDRRHRQEFAEVFAGNRLLAGMQPFAACYGGHQFGSWAGQLGDGRAISLGEMAGADGQLWELQLKGAGPTPYSRGADGRAVLRSSVREFLCSEAMHHLGVPTTRALSLVATGDDVVRDMFYTGHPKAEPGAVVCRVAPSFLRFGSFELFTSRGDEETLRTLADFTLAHYFSHLGAPAPETYLRWFDEVCERTGRMIAQWMGVGFVHGVMNTDNMSILGLTIDYGPYGWLEDYDPNWTPNTTDAAGRRYAFGNQMAIALHNLGRLAGAILPLIGSVPPLEEVLRGHVKAFEKNYRSTMAQKLGLLNLDSQEVGALVDQLPRLLQTVETDMTLFFRNLAHVNVQPASDLSNEVLMEPIAQAFYKPAEIDEPARSTFGDWLRDYGQAVQAEGRPTAERIQQMNRTNPKYVLRNYLAQLAIDKAAAGDNSLVHELLELLRRPYDEQPDKQEFAQKRPEWARNRPGCSMLSCSS